MPLRVAAKISDNLTGPVNARNGRFGSSRDSPPALPARQVYIRNRTTLQRQWGSAFNEIREIVPCSLPRFFARPIPLLCVGSIEPVLRCATGVVLSGWRRADEGRLNR